MERSWLIQNTLTKRDYRKIVYLNIYKRERLSPFIFVITLPLSILIIIERFIYPEMVSNFMFYTSCLFLILLFLFYLVLETAIRRFIKSDKRIIDHPMKIQIRDEGMEVSNPEQGSETHYAWNTIYKVLETKEFLLFYVNTMRAEIISKKKIENLKGLKSFLKEKLGAKYKMKK